MNIVLTEHVLIRYIERFNPNLASITNSDERFNRARMAVMCILKSAHYVSDDHRGVLLHSPSHNCNLIVQSKRLITIYSPGQKAQRREGKQKQYEQ